MTFIICFLIALVAAAVGSICGIGGGIVIKPILDATGLVGVSQASALSGLTVLAMATVSLTMRCGWRAERSTLKGRSFWRSARSRAGSSERDCFSWRAPGLARSRRG